MRNNCSGHSTHSQGSCCARFNRSAWAHAKRCCKKLGMTQPAISQYKRELRGKKKLIDDNEILQQIKNIASKVASGELDSNSATMEFCDICKLVRKKKLICKMHMTSLSIKNCTMCDDFNC